MRSRQLVAVSVEEDQRARPGESAEQRLHAVEESPAYSDTERRSAASPLEVRMILLDLPNDRSGVRRRMAVVEHWVPMP